MNRRYERVVALDPDLKKVIPFLPVLDLNDLEASRARLLEQAGARSANAEPVYSVVDREAQSRGRTVGVRIYRSVVGADAPVVVYLHGGGFVLGSIETADGWCRRLANLTRAVVVSVDYRLAPEHPFPAAVDDAHVAYGWVLDNAAELGLDADRIALVGDSAGAGIVASLTIRLRDGGHSLPRIQVLCAPQLDPEGDSDSMARFFDTPLWNAALAAQSWRLYLGGRPWRDLGPEVAPARIEDAAGLPETFVYAHEYDPLRDDAMTFASALFAAGVPTGLAVYRGTFHGSRTIEAAASSARIVSDLVSVLTDVLHGGDDAG